VQHPVDDAEARVFLESLTYGTDLRKPPDNRRRGQFRRQWHRGAHGEPMREQTLRKVLTWANLGYRAGRQFGAASDATIDAMFDHFAVIYQRNGGPTRQQREG